MRGRARRRRGRGDHGPLPLARGDAGSRSRRAARPIRDADGNVAYLLGTARDVSEREELRDRVREIDALYRVADAIGRTTSLNELFDEAIDTLLDATDADRASILLYDEAQTMRFRASRGLSDDYRAATEGHSPWTPDDRRPGAGARPRRRRRRASSRTSRRRPCARASARSPSSRSSTTAACSASSCSTATRRTSGSTARCASAGTIANHLASATVRTRARTALRDSREQLETIMRTVDEGIIVQSADGRDRLRERQRRPRDRLRRRRGASSRPTANEVLGAVRDARRGRRPARARRPSRPPRAARRDERARRSATATGRRARSAGRSCARTPSRTRRARSRSSVSVIHDVTRVEARRAARELPDARRASC